ncbi:HAD-IA family hydrolase [Erythrobacter sp. SCSIO 43205]|uniref:HAD-IA family hydrolase n=1 Tax=Erythrobacter sp. SCSIO 43205 TaxID=2779361 RepID=UPI001CA8F191|nr:HAD-IA family hydrolase [Erythrobacter sp. SCSIO 43205]UAB79085.1 HAD-IA family hydrolase [Erythrobacter sp. SCSIO 43205]
MTRLAVFDCDGTLVDSQADIIWSMARAFELAGLPSPDPNQVRRVVGLSLPVALRELAPSAEHRQQQQIVEHYKTAFRQRREEGLLQEPLYDGMEQLLRRLHADGWSLAVATGKSDRGLNACLTGHGLIDLFVSLQTADRHPSKPHPAMLEAALFEAGAQPNQSVVIGDTSFDMQMAVAARVRAVGVAWGYHSPQDLIATGADTVANTMDELRLALEDAL